LGLLALGINGLTGSAPFTAAAIACFAEGTLITTDQGHIPVESLAVGMMCHTPGGIRPILWLGHRKVDCNRHPDPQTVWPIRIEANAFGPSRPVRDLLLSPEHAIFQDGVLIRAGDLINGTSIIQVPVDSITYWHVELDAHDIILAENLECESFLENDNRDDFDHEGLMTLHPHFEGSQGPQICAPLVRQGPVLEQVRDALAKAAQPKAA